MNKLLPVLLLLSSPAYPCDWVSKVTTDPMTDVRTCWVSSAAAKVAFYKRGTDRPRPIAGSPYFDSGLEIRIDDNKAISLGRHAVSLTDSITALLSQIESGQRIRTAWRDYPSNQAGDAPICTLPALLAACEP